MNKTLFLLLLISFNSFSQTVEVKYFENVLVKNKDQYNTLPENVKVIYKPNFYSYKLVTDGTSSLYQNEKINLNLKEETNQIMSVGENGDTIKSVTTSSGFDIRTKERLHFKDFKNDKSYNEKFYQESVKIVDSVAVWNWTILEETEIIAGYNCTKATANFLGSDFYAWFAPEIPIADGPLNYSGLPGMILKVQLNSFEIVAYDVKFKKEVLDIKPPNFKGKVYNYKQFMEEINRRNKK